MDNTHGVGVERERSGMGGAEEAPRGGQRREQGGRGGEGRKGAIGTMNSNPEK